MWCGVDTGWPVMMREKVELTVRMWLSEGNVRN